MWTRVRVLGAGTCRRVSDDRLVLGGRPCCSILDQRRLRALETEARLWCVWPSAYAQLLLAAVARLCLVVVHAAPLSTSVACGVCGLAHTLSCCLLLSLLPRLPLLPFPQLLLLSPLERCERYQRGCCC